MKDDYRPNPPPMFPVKGDPIIKAIPLAVLYENREWANKNHGMSLTRLHHRGGLTLLEAYCIVAAIPIPNKPWSDDQLRLALISYISKVGSQIWPENKEQAK